MTGGGDMRFLIDAQLPPALANLLKDQGHVAEHVADVGLRDANDLTIREYAATHDAVVVSKDEDFAEHQRLHPGGPAIVWLRVGNSSNAALLAWFMPILPDIEERIAAGETLIEVI